MAAITLTGSRRQQLGKGGARKARAAGQIPGVLYGHGETPVSVAIGSVEFDQAMRGRPGANPLINLRLEGSEVSALIRAVQYDPMTHGILHIDFQHISLTESVEVQVAIHLTGLAIGVKDAGGILEHIARSIEVRCLPTAIPSSVDVDVSALNIGDSIHVRDLSVPNVTILTDRDATIAAVVAPTVMEEKPAEEVAATATAEPEVIAKGKKEEEGEEAKEGKGEKAEKAEKPEKSEKKEKK
jgi:large subunit ribosomal protein L25